MSDSDENVDWLNSAIKDKEERTGATIERHTGFKAIDDLRVFQKYSAQIPTEIINSTSRGSERMLVRKSSFLQLIGALQGIRANPDSGATWEQDDTMGEFMKKYGGIDFSTQKLVTKENIEEALGLLEGLGIDMSLQKAQLHQSIVNQAPRN